MLCKIAWHNVRRAGRDYLVYLITLTLAVTVFYAFNTISVQVDIAGVSDQNAGMGDLLGSIISGLTVFLALVMGFLMVYANNFIMKRRKKEFGLYQVLGMGRGQVARIMALETFFVSPPPPPLRSPAARSRWGSCSASGSRSSWSSLRRRSSKRRSPTSASSSRPRRSLPPSVASRRSSS